MKHVIMIAYYFPPEGNAGSYRPLRFAQCLPAEGWSSCVITQATDRYERYDPGLLALIPRDTEVIRAQPRDLWLAIQARRARKRKQLSSIPVQRETRKHVALCNRIRASLRETVRRAEAWCYHPDMAMGWIRPAVKATVKACKRIQPNVIWATAGPISSFVVAERASRRTGVPYVLDFRDAWTITYNEFEARRPARATRSDRCNLYRFLKGAQAVVFRYDTEAECYWHFYPGAIDASRCHIIPNGYVGQIDVFNTPPGDKCKVLYTGTVSDYYYKALLLALQSLREHSQNLAERLSFHFVGEGAEALCDEAARLGIADIVRAEGPTTQEAVALLSKGAHALLVLGRPPTMRGYELFAGAKLFGCLKSGRPILGIVPDDETRKILQRVRVSTIADASSPSDIVTILQKLLDAWSAGTLALLVPDRRACEAYSAERQTAALARALDGLPAAEPFIPGSVEIPPSLKAWIGSHESEMPKLPSARPAGATT
jgi:hypothetical protein